MHSRSTRVLGPAVLVGVWLAAPLAGLWLVSQVRCLTVSRAAGSLVRNERFADGQMGAWEYRASTWTLQSYPHQFRVVRSEYLSVMQHADEADRFRETRGWRAGGFPRGAIREDYGLLFEFEPAAWRVLGLGMAEVTRGGQLLRFWDVPYWLLISVFCAPALIAWRRARRRRRWQCERRCLACGYQLDPAMDRCPECGAVRIKDPE